MKPTSFSTRFFASALSLIIPCIASSLSAAGAESGPVEVKDEDGKVVVKFGGKLFTEYHYKDVSRPYFYPIIGPSGAAMTRNWPMKNVPDEDHDHPHQKSLWYSHGDVNGHDFWAEGPKSGKTVQDSLRIESSSGAGAIKSKNKLVAVDGTVVCTDDRTMRFYNRPNERILDFEITIHADHGELTFGDTKEGAMAIRLAESMKVKRGHGNIVNSEGRRDDKNDKNTWGKRANWVDYFGPVEGKTVGVAIFDHPKNPRHPTWWHVRDYGLFAANPFGVHDFEAASDKTKGNFVIPAGESRTFRYRFYFHDGDEKQARVAEHYDEYVRMPASGTSTK